jgi:putative hydrolase of HD superfamily
VAERGEVGMTRVHFTSMDAAGLYNPINDLARLAMDFGLINRTAVRHADRVTPESDTDHTVMLAWLAPALAARCCPDLDVGLVCQFAVIHDAPEVLAGDTSTLRITPEERKAKEEREVQAAQDLDARFRQHLPWFPDMIFRYESQADPEARLVKAIDKFAVKLVHLIDGCSGIRDHGVTAIEFGEMVETQRASLASYASDFPGLLGLYNRLVAEVEANLRELEMPAGVERNAEALKVTMDQSGHVERVCAKPCPTVESGRQCMFCDGGLFDCVRCGSFEGATTTRCPGRSMTAEEVDAVYAGRLDFRCKPDGSGWWVCVGSPHTPNRGWRLPGE